MSKILLFAILVVSLAGCASHQGGESVENRVDGGETIVGQCQTLEDSLTRGWLVYQNWRSVESAMPREGMSEYLFVVNCCDTCPYSLDVQIRMQYPEMPDNSYHSYETDNGLRRFYSCMLCDWVEYVTHHRPKVYIPKTFTWSADSLAHYYEMKLEKIVGPKLRKEHASDIFHVDDGTTGYAEITMFEVYRDRKYATVCAFECLFLNGMAHRYYKYSYYTVDTKAAGAMSLGFDQIFKQEDRNLVLKLLAETMCEELGESVRQVEDYEGDFTFLKTDNLALVPEGVLFYYPPYELGCYAEGQMNIILPYNLVEHYLQPEIVAQKSEEWFPGQVP